ncbi:MAG: class I SAM-dependent methyltransferase [Acidimicrobiales bacterium]
MATEWTDEAHWVRWHRAYEDPGSAHSARLRHVQSGVRAAFDECAPGTIRVLSLCAGQGRDVIDVVAGHRRRPDVRAVLVELDPELVAFARDRAEAAGVDGQVTVVEGDASWPRLYGHAFPADLVLVCGVFGNISDEDIRSTIRSLPSLCAPGATVLWTRHRRPPDLTPAILEWFDDAGFEVQSFVAPEQYVFSVGSHRFVGAGAVSPGSSSPGDLDPSRRLFDFIGDGHLPA